MLHDPSQLFALLWSGRTPAWPSQLLALIWIAWLISWAVASFWSGRTEKHVMISASQAYRVPIYSGSHSAYALDRAGVGRETALAFWQRRYVRACGVDLGGYVVHVVGTNLSRTLLVERDHAQGRHWVVTYRPVRAGAPPDLYGAHRSQYWHERAPRSGR